jgi:toxin ParE1/3/4
MNLRVTRRAARDLKDIADYIHERNPEAAIRVRGTIIRSLRTLLLFPNLGRRQITEGVRKVVSPRYGYIIYYSIDHAAGEIAILSIQHPARGRTYSDL